MTPVEEEVEPFPIELNADDQKMYEDIVVSCVAVSLCPQPVGVHHSIAFRLAHTYFSR
jgi:hypothetical protein